MTSYPTIKFFPKGSSNGEFYNGGRSASDLVDFINKKVGTHRLAGGGLDTEAGTIKVLDAIVTKVSDWQESATIDGLTKAAKDAKEAYAEYYVKVATKLKKSQNYAVSELKRLEGIMAKGGLAGVKKDDLMSRTNILKKFINKPEVKDEL